MTRPILAASAIPVPNTVEQRIKKLEMMQGVISNMLGANVLSSGADPTGGSDSTAAFIGAASKTGPRQNIIVPPGTYKCGPITLPCGMFGIDPNATRIVRSDTAGGDFIHLTTSHASVSGLTLDGQRASQPQNTAGGTLAIFKPNGICPSGTFAGAMTLSGNVSAAATSISVLTATFGGVQVQPGDYLSLVDGAKHEYVQVANNYTAGATTIPLYDPVSQSFASATCNVICCPSGTNVYDCVIYGGQRDAVYVWNGAGCKVIANRVYDCADTAIDLPAGGFNNIVAQNNVRTNGRYGIVVDTTSSTAFVPTARGNTIALNDVAIVSGGSDPNGAMLYGIIALLCEHTDVLGNEVSIDKAGVEGIRLNGATYAKVADNRIIGPGSSGTGASATSTIGIHDPVGGDTRCRVSRNNIRGTDRGIQLEKTRHAIVDGNEIYNVLNYAIDFEVDTGNQQTFIVTANQIDGCVAGIRGGGAGGTSIIKTGLNDIFNASFAAITSDAGWTVTSIAGFA